MSLLKPDHIRVAITMMGRANCTGQEAAAVATTIQVLQQELQRMSAPPKPMPEKEPEEQVDDNS